MRHTRLLTILIGLTLNLASTALAADRRIEGTVKAVDADKATITLTTRAGAAAKDETLDVVKKAKITVNGQPATLKEVRRGQKAVAVFNADLEVVTRLDATGEGVALLVPEIAVLNELPEAEGPRASPWPTADGLTLYWMSRPGVGVGQPWIWTARRRSKDGLFEDPRRLVPGGVATVSSDGLEMILRQGDDYYVATRPTADAAFARPRKVAEFDGQARLGPACLGGNDLILYVDRYVTGQPVSLVKFTRADRRARWVGPSPIRVALPAGKLARDFFVTPDGSRAFCALADEDPNQPLGRVDMTRGEIAILRADGDGFGRPAVIRIDGEPLLGVFPRYVAATNELFFVQAGDGQPPRILVVRNFDPDAIETAPVAPAAASKPARTDRELLQGNWVSVSEVNSGTALTAEQLQGMNKRMEVREDRMVIRRTGLNGKFAVFEGTFRLDPKAKPKTFDWTGKGPDGQFELHGIYELVGDTFRLCHGPGPRPTELHSTAGSRRQLIVYKREGAGPPPPAAETARRPPQGNRSSGPYYKVSYSTPDKKQPNLQLDYTIWIPEGLPRLRGVIVHMHGNGSYEAGALAAYDLHWQALARKWGCALLAPSFHQGPTKQEQNANWHRYFIPGGGSHEVFLGALHDLGAKSNHPELE